MFDDAIDVHRPLGTSMSNRRFLFLQGPHGPFFRQLARMLESGGSSCQRIAFNAGDAAFWWPKNGLIPFTAAEDEWSGFLIKALKDNDITDLVLYGEMRPRHKLALEIARTKNIRTHIFEEGYIRPYWITYERDGSNGNSPLLQIPQSAMRPTVPASPDLEAGTGWGDIRQHIFYGALYHAALMIGRHRFPNFKSHRNISVSREAWLNFVRFLAFPIHVIERRIATSAVKRSDYPFHLALLQLEHDASFQDHSRFKSMISFIDEVVDGFARGAQAHHHLVFKAHPLDDGRVDMRKAVRQAALRSNMTDRVHFIPGGKLAGLLDDALSAVTINSTAGQQVLRRGIPLKILGNAVYCQPGFGSDQSLSNFFRRPDTPDLEGYRDYRRYLLETCQVQGGYYSTVGRRRLMRRIVDMMLDDLGPYARRNLAAAPAQHISIVR